MNRITGASTSSRHFISGESEQNYLTEELVDAIKLKAENFLEGAKKVTKAMGDIFKPEDWISHESECENVTTANKNWRTKVEDIQAKAAEVVSIAKSNIEKATERQEKLNKLTNVTENLKVQSSKHRELAFKLKSKHKKVDFKWKLGKGQNPRFKIKKRKKHLRLKVTIGVVGAVALILILI